LFRCKRQQKTIFDHDVYLTAERVAALDATWAGPFRRSVLPLIDEEPFRAFYCPDNGRPNVPVALLIALCILKEMHHLTDLQMLGSLEFDLRWQHALNINVFEGDVCQKTLHNFRTLVAFNGKAREIFSTITGKIIDQAGLATGKQRLDSTHIISNMADLSRLELFVRTIEGFLRRLAKRFPDLYGKLPALYDKVYLERSGYFADSRSSKARRRLAKCAAHLFDLVDRFRDHPEITQMKAYHLMARLFEEQCGIDPVEPAKVVLKAAGEISADSLQNPSDPDATYGHKGKGYKASLTETCEKENPFQVITDVALESAHASDQKDVLPVIERLDDQGCKPEELFADAGYGSGDNILEAGEQGVRLSAPITCGKTPEPDRMRLADFDVTPDCRTVLACVMGHPPLHCRSIGKDKVEAVFCASHCAGCEFLPYCLVKRDKRGDHRLKYNRKDMATSRRRHEQESKSFKERYKIRSGIEATISEADRVTGLKRAWTRGGVRVGMSLFMKALAINIKRFVGNALEEAKKTSDRPQMAGIVSYFSVSPEWEDFFPPVALFQAA
jgi:Transposase DDE domain/Transposase domain (DUF772)